MKLQTPVFRVAFPQVFEAKAAPGSEKKKYSVVMLFTIADMKDAIEKKKYADMKTAAQQVAMEKWPKGIPKNFISPFHDGVEKQEYQGYGAGVIYVTASRSEKAGKPGVVDAKLAKIIATEDFYGGCYARATVNPYAWEYMGKCGVSFGLQNIQKVKDGEPFGSFSRAEDDFSADDSMAEETQVSAGTGLFD